MAKLSLEDLRTYNRWWLSKEAINTDIHIKNFEKSRIKWHPSLIKEIELDKDAIYSVRGPRQAGKTTLIKLLIRSLLGKIDQKTIFFYSCDTLTKEDLQEIINLYLDFLQY